MKKYLLALVGCALLLVGCETKTGTGALAGGALGAGTGALIGGGSGAAIGGAVGAVSGGLVGAALDEQDRKIMEQQNPQTVERIDRGLQLTTNDVVDMSKAGLNDNVIINQIESTGSVFYLSSDEIIYLKEENVSQRVINYMIQTGSRY